MCKSLKPGLLALPTTAVIAGCGRMQSQSDPANRLQAAEDKPTDLNLASSVDRY